MLGMPSLPMTVLPTKSVNTYEVVLPPEDTVATLQFSPPALQQNYLIAGGWDNSVRCWEVENSGTTIAKAIQKFSAPVLDACWSDDGTKVFVAGCDQQANMWDLTSNQVVQVAQHDAPVKTCHWVRSPNSCYLITGSWDKTLKFWDTRSPNPLLTMSLPERCYCADVIYPLALVATAGRSIVMYSLENTPSEFRRQESPLKFQHRSIAIFRDQNKLTTGYAVGSIEGRVAVQYLLPGSTKDSFTFKCHRTMNTSGIQDIYAINDIVFHPVHGTLVTAGSDGSYSFWDKDSRTKLKASESLDLPVTKCAINHTGQIMAYALGYDWSKGHEYNNTAKKPQIFLRPCFEDLKPRPLPPQ